MFPMYPKFKCTIVKHSTATAKNKQNQHPRPNQLSTAQTSTTTSKTPTTTMDTKDTMATMVKQSLGKTSTTPATTTSKTNSHHNVPNVPKVQCTIGKHSTATTKTNKTHSHNQTNSQQLKLQQQPAKSQPPQWTRRTLWPQWSNNLWEKLQQRQQQQPKPTKLTSTAKPTLTHSTLFVRSGRSRRNLEKPNQPIHYPRFQSNRDVCIFAVFHRGHCALRVHCGENVYVLGAGGEGCSSVVTSMDSNRHSIPDSTLRFHPPHLGQGVKNRSFS